jgi:RNA polymerase sigma-70 factor (ECF subfamily)
MADLGPPFNPIETSSFEHTNWVTVAQAGAPAAPENDAARSSIYQNYWYPIYFYIRRLGRSAEDSQDLTQDFFSRVFEKNYLQSADRAKGKFRSFMLIMLKHFLADEWDRANRQKRGGGMELLSLNQQDTEFRYRTEPADNCSPDKAFERSWATNLLDLVLKRLKEECDASGKGLVFLELKPFLTSEQEITGADAARKLGITENHLKVTLHRLRNRCRELLRAEIARTASSLEQIEEEIQDLYAALRQH